MMYTLEDFNYGRVAAFIDGEGCISLTKRKYTNKNGDKKTYYYPNITVGMKHQETIAHIHSVMGVGEVYEHRGVHIWSVHNADVKKVINRIYPYLITKKDQAETILGFYKEQANPEAIYWKNRFEKLNGYR